ncbi:MAG: hypothetical protein ACTSRZ_05405 [Promethearchaeota archaeon]
MVASSSSDKKTKGFRKLPFVSGVMMLYISFIAVIPLGAFSSLTSYSLSDITLEILNVDNTKIYIWGPLKNSNPLIDFSMLNFNTILSLLPWIGCVLAAIFCLIGSSYNENPIILKKLLKFASFLLIMILISYVGIYIFWKYTPNTVISFGPGFVVIILSLVILISGIIKMTDYWEKKE